MAASLPLGCSRLVTEVVGLCIFAAASEPLSGPGASHSGSGASPLCPETHSQILSSVRSLAKRFSRGRGTDRSAAPSGHGQDASAKETLSQAPPVSFRTPARGPPNPWGSGLPASEIPLLLTLFLCPSPDTFNLVPYYDKYPPRTIYLRKYKEDLKADGYEFSSHPGTGLLSDLRKALNLSEHQASFPRGRQNTMF